MALKLLLAAPENAYFNGVLSGLVDAGYDVTLASTGMDAQIQLGQKKFFHVLLAYEIKQHNAITVMKFVKFNCPSARVSMTISNEAIKALEEEEKQDFASIRSRLYQLGLFKIFEGVTDPADIVNFMDSQQNFNDLVSNIQESEGEKKITDPIELADAEFVQIEIDHFFSTSKNLFDVYIKIGGGKYVKILHKGEEFDQSQIKKYKEEKNVEFLYFKKQDHKKYIRTLSEINRKVIQLDNVSSMTKYTMTKHVTSEVLKSAWIEGINHGLVDQASEVCDNILQMVTKEKKLHTLMRQMQEMNPAEYEHSFLVAFFSCAVAKQFEWNSPVTTQSLSMASMFHDLGLTKIDPAIREKKKSEMTKEEQAIYNMHPQYSLELLENNPNISRTILQIIHQHHECIDGTGYPNNLSSNKILMLSQVLIFVNEFADLMVAENLRPVDTLKKMLIAPDIFKRHNSHIVENFSHVFIDPDVLIRKKVS